MKLVKQCKTCKFNCSGVCSVGGDTYQYGEKIVDDKKYCDSWKAGMDYYNYATTNAPRFLREQFNDCQISYEVFSSQFDNYNAGNSVPINFFDAIKFIYGISMVDIAVLLDVTFGVVYRAKTKGIPQKRIFQFANALCVESELLGTVTTSDFDKLRSSREIFFKQPNLEQRINSMPEWKKNLANTISSIHLRCPIHMAKKFARVDKFYWTSEMSLDDFTESERELVKYMSDHSKKEGTLSTLEYTLDIACQPHMSVIIDTK